MRKLQALIFGILIAVTVGAIAQRTGGFPSRPRFQAVGIGTTAPTDVGSLTATNSIHINSAATGANFRVTAGQPRFCAEENDAVAGEQSWIFRANGGTFTLLTGADQCSVIGAGTVFAVERTGATVDSIALTATDVTVNGVSVAAESGTFTASMGAACNTTPTITFDYQKIGNIVTLQAVADSGFPCTSDSTSFLSSAGAAPVSIRPASGTGARSTPLDSFENAGVEAWAVMQVGTDGAIGFFRCATFGANCGTWTNSGDKGFESKQHSFTYMLGNP
jgi:hypothetical protein